jgi:hypothetical protein
LARLLGLDLGRVECFFPFRRELTIMERHEAVPHGLDVTRLVGSKRALLVGNERAFVARLTLRKWAVMRSTVCGGAPLAGIHTGRQIVRILW